VTHFRQCLVRNLYGDMVTWLPERFAAVGKRVDLKEGRKWSKGWEVIAVYHQRLSEEYIREHERDHKHQREASDI
jgi:hypothetical protein